MNPQGKRKGGEFVSLGIEWTHRYGPGSGYTWNPLGGCKHGCEWDMPDGSRAICYAKTVAERVAQSAYPQGFEHHYSHLDRLNEPLRQTKQSGIFLDSMSDLMGGWVSADEINKVMDVCRAAFWHTFFLLTKNAPRLPDFDIPANVWVGASSPPDWMAGARLTPDQQDRRLRAALVALDRVKVPVRWMSFEPYSRDYADIIAEHPGVLQWAVIGAASNGRIEYDLNTDHLVRLLDVLDAQGVPVFFKGNLGVNKHALGHWRSEFPKLPQPE